MYNFPLSVTLRAALTMSQSSQSYSPRLTCNHTHRVLLAIVLAARSVLIAILLIVVVHITSYSSRHAQRVVSYLPTFLCFRTKCGSSIYRCTLDRMNRTGLSHYAWDPLRVCQCNKSICYNVPCLNRQRDCGAMTYVVRTPYALTRLRPEGTCPNMAASRRKMP